MSELNENVITLQTEDEKYALYDVKSPQMKVLLLHGHLSISEVKTFVETLKLQTKHDAPLLIVVDKQKETKFTDLEKIIGFVNDNTNKRKEKEAEMVSLSQQLIKEIPFHVQPKVQEAFLPDYRTNNPHRNSKSRNCKIRRK